MVDLCDVPTPNWCNIYINLVLFLNYFHLLIGLFACAIASMTPS